MPHIPPDLLLGDARLDGHHRFLFSLLAAADTAKPGPLSPFELTSLVKAILIYALQHFKDEEAMMETDGWPGLASHRFAHRKFSKQCDDLLALGCAGNKTKSGEFVIPGGAMTGSLTAKMVVDTLRGYLVDQISDTIIGDAAYVIWRKRQGLG